MSLGGDCLRSAFLIFSVINCSVIPHKLSVFNIVSRIDEQSEHYRSLRAKQLKTFGRHHQQSAEFRFLRKTRSILAQPISTRLQNPVK